MNYKREIVKKLFLVIAIAFTMLAANAADNQLETVILEGTEAGYNVILRTDTVGKVKKHVLSKDKITLELKGITSTNTVNTLYRNTSAVNSLIVENNGNDELKIYIAAEDIANAAIIFETPAAPPVYASDNLSTEKLLWAGFVFILLVGITATTKSLKTEPESNVMLSDIKQREMEMYRNFKKELAQMPSINYNVKARTRYASNVIKTRTGGKTIRELEKVS